MNYQETIMTGPRIEARATAPAGLDVTLLATAINRALQVHDASRWVMVWADPSDRTGSWDLTLDFAEFVAAEYAALAADSEPVDGD